MSFSQTDPRLLSKVGILFGVSSSKLEVSRFNPGISRFNLGVSSFELEISCFKLGISRLKRKVSCLKLEVPGFKLKVSRFKLELSHFDLGVSRLKRVDAQWLVARHRTIIENHQQAIAQFSMILFRPNRDNFHSLSTVNRFFWLLICDELDCTH